MHRSDSMFHTVCEHEINDCVLADKCEHHTIIRKKKKTHILTHIVCIRSSLNEYDTFPFDKRRVQYNVSLYLFYQRPLTIYICRVNIRYVCSW